LDHNDYVYDAEFPSRKLVGRVVRVERIGDPPYGRVSYEIDCIDGDVPSSKLVSALYENESLKLFAALRLLTTPHRLSDLIGVEFQEGDWVQLNIAPRDGRPRPIVFHSQLRANGYTEQSRGSLFGADVLFSDKDTGLRPRSLGAAASSTTSAAVTVAAASTFPLTAIATRRQVVALLAQLSTVEHLIVHDVGQANFVTLVGEKNDALAHFDAGWPISFNGRTAPNVNSISANAAPIILSHWDFDHLLGFYRFPFTRDSIWLTPVQALGPGQARVACQLADKKRLLGWSGGTLTVGKTTLFDCNGPQGSNDSGLSLEVVLSSGKRVLLVGDASYGSVPTSSSDRFDFLIVTHHGALFSGAVPRAAGRRASGVISVGEGNVYKHPRDEAVLRHTNGGWTVSATAAIYQPRRGDRILGRSEEA
jgi:beta-lactamase superfamily II metal-dependent hydrolase